jgi:starvation-inducible DNA-binding protein
MSNTALKEAPKGSDHISPHWKQSARPIQKFGTVIRSLPIGIDEKKRTEICEQLNLMLADTSTLRDLYKKSHWQVAGPTFYQLHLLFDKHFGEQVELVDLLAERIQTLGGVSVAMAHDIADLTRLERPHATVRRFRCRFHGSSKLMSR